ncbi:MAG TPA: peptidylprolyl isomerase [Bacteroidales bacterium]|nr:peptidylprolyl isomerase [Bacteroidales bacterium]HRX95355.1 peptidylprolyl isomerase [Bacteroidales bacterium]
MKQHTIYVLFSVLAISILITGCKKDAEEEEPKCDPFSVDLGEDKVLNEGEIITLDVTVINASYMWSTGETTASISVDTTGMYWVAVTTCFGTVSDTINVNIRYKTIKLATDFGDISIWLYHQTPLHRENFLNLVTDQFYDGLIFHRVVENFVIQGGDPEGTGYGGPGYTIPAEIISGINHLYGAVGAARLGDDVNPEKASNGSQFYIVSDQNGEPGLNGEYTVFGQVFNGLDVVYSISLVAVDGNKRPLEDVLMNSVSIEYFTASELESLYGFIVPQ